MAKNALIAVGKHGITAHEVQVEGGQCRKPLIFFGGESTLEFPHAKSVDEAIKMLEAQGYDVVVQDCMFGSGFYGISHHHGAGGVCKGWQFFELLTMKEQEELDKSERLNLANGKGYKSALQFVCEKLNKRNHELLYGLTN